jgi:hypothetical protein
VSGERGDEDDDLWLRLSELACWKDGEMGYLMSYIDVVNIELNQLIRSTTRTRCKDLIVQKHMCITISGTKMPQ